VVQKMARGKQNFTPGLRSADHLCIHLLDVNLDGLLLLLSGHWYLYFENTVFELRPEAARIDPFWQSHAAVKLSCKPLHSVVVRFVDFRFLFPLSSDN